MNIHIQTTEHELVVAILEATMTACRDFTVTIDNHDDEGRGGYDLYQDHVNRGIVKRAVDPEMTWQRHIDRMDRLAEFERQYDQFLDWDCPFCGVLRGEECRTGMGRNLLRPMVHAARRRVCHEAVVQPEPRKRAVPTNSAEPTEVTHNWDFVTLDEM